MHNIMRAKISSYMLNYLCAESKVRQKVRQLMYVAILVLSRKQLVNRTTLSGRVVLITTERSLPIRLPQCRCVPLRSNMSTVRPRLWRYVARRHQKVLLRSNVSSVRLRKDRW